jgi:hypothetical protein
MAMNARIMYYIIIAALIGVAIFTLVGQMNSLSNVSGEVSSGAVGGWYYTLDFISNILITLVSIYCFAVYSNKFPVIINVCYIAMLVLIFIASIGDLSVYSKQPSFFYSAKGLGTWINFGILYFVAEEVYTTQIFKFFKGFCYIVVFFNLLRLAMIGGISSRADTLSAFGETTIYLIWVYPFFFFDNSDKTNVAKIVKYVMILLIAFFAFAIESRSYMLITILFLLIKLKRDLKEAKSAMLIVVMTGMFLMIGYYFVANINHFNSIKGILNVFAGRIDDDTRSSQLKDFLSQFNTDKLFSGVGPTGTWNWASQNQPHYEWLDNQLILATWWFGIQTCLIYVLFVAYPLFRKNTFNNINITNAKIMIFFWILACAGLAIYVTFSTKLFYYFISLLIGVTTLNVRELRLFSISKPQTVPVDI